MKEDSLNVTLVIRSDESHHAQQVKLITSSPDQKVMERWSFTSTQTTNEKFPNAEWLVEKKNG